MQPQWQCVAQLGDRNPIDYGGLWVFEDTTGVYDPECEALIVDDGDDTLTAYRYILESCTYIDGVLSDNKFHPDHAAWFADGLPNMASYVGRSVAELTALFCSADSRERAEAWRIVGDYYGYENLDSYPLTMGLVEARRRYNKGYEVGR